MFYVVDEGLTSITDDPIPDRWVLIARDAFNGLVLWKQSIDEWGWQHWSAIQFDGTMRFKGPDQLYRRLVAAGDRVYVTLGFNAPLTALASLLLVMLAGGAGAVGEAEGVGRMAAEGDGDDRRGVDDVDLHRRAQLLAQVVEGLLVARHLARRGALAVLLRACGPAEDPGASRLEQLLVSVRRVVLVERMRVGVGVDIVEVPAAARPRRGRDDRRRKRRRDHRVGKPPLHLAFAAPLPSPVCDAPARAESH